MMDLHDNLGGNSQPEELCLENKGVLSAYLLECQLKRILAGIEPDFKTLQEKTKLSRMNLERAVYDQVYRLDAGQLFHALRVYRENGWEALVVFLHHPKLPSTPSARKAA